MLVVIHKQISVNVPREIFFWFRKITAEEFRIHSLLRLKGNPYFRMTRLLL